MNDAASSWYPYKKSLFFSFLFAFCFHAVLFAFIRHLPAARDLQIKPPERIRVRLRQSSPIKSPNIDLHKVKPTRFSPAVPPVKQKRVLPKVKKVVKPVRHKTIPKKAKKPMPERLKPENTVSESPDTKKTWINEAVNTAVPSIYTPHVASSPARQESGVKGPPAPQKKVLAYPDYAKNPGLSYPQLALRRGLEGRVVLKVQVSKEGRSLQVTLAKSSGHSVLDRAAIKTVRKWIFKPGKLNGVPVDMWVEVPIVYQLK